MIEPIHTTPEATIDRTPLTDRPRAAMSADLPRGFEAMILRPFLDSALPRSEAVFGGGTGGDAWRSMLIDALARDWAERGSLGIAERLLPDHTTGIEAPGEETVS